MQASVGSNGRPARPILTRIAAKFQVTVPPEVRELFDLKEGDLFDWSFNRATSQLVITPKRAQLITPLLQQEMDEFQAAEVDVEEEAAVA